MTQSFRVVYFTSHGYEPYGEQLKAECLKYKLHWTWYTEDWLREQPISDSMLAMINVHKRGFGYWCWKPYILKHALATYSEDTVLYLDSSVVFACDPTAFVSEWPTPWAAETAWTQSDWTKRDCFVLMGCDSKEYWEMLHLWAGCLLFDRDNRSILSEWQSWLLDPRVVSDNPNVMGLPDLQRFRDHRHDQSILGNLFRQHTLMLYKMPRCDNEYLVHDAQPGDKSN